MRFLVGKKLLLFVACVAASAGLMASVGEPVAAAAPVSCSAGPSWTVSTETELNDAIDCYNAATTAGDYTIDVVADIVSTQEFLVAADAASFAGVTQGNPDLALTIDGNGFTLTGSGTEGSARAALAVNAPSGGPLITISDLRVEGGYPGILARSGAVELQFVALVNNGNGLGIGRDATVVVHDSAISSNNVFGIVNGGSLVVSNTIVSQNRGDGILSLGPLIVSQSGIVENGRRALWTFGPTDIINSTVTGVESRIAVVVSADMARISNSTIRGFGTFSFHSLALIGGSASVQSSIVGSCNAGIIDAGNNHGRCFNADVGLFPPADYGCITPTPAGCVPTSELLNGAAPTNNGNCANVPVLDPVSNTVVIGDLAVDQRGVPRTPVGAGCDAGAFEGADCSSPTVWTVTSQVTLDAAIACYSTAPVAATYTITLASDFTLTGTHEVYVPEPGVLMPRLILVSSPQINQQGGGYALIIDGAGFTVTGTGDLGLGPQHVFLVSGSPVTFRNIGITGGGTGIELLYNGLLRVEDSRIFGNSLGVASNPGTTHVVITNSSISYNNVAIDATGNIFGGAFTNERLMIVDSMIAGNSVITDFPNVVVSNSTLSGANLTGTGLGGIVVANSTIVAGTLSMANGGFVVSSIVESCSGATDLGRNVGGCFGTDPVLLGAFADNGCTNPTSFGCTQTYELLPASAGVGTGICSGTIVVDAATGFADLGDLLTDQRGSPRTPVGVGCDAGAFELEAP